MKFSQIKIINILSFDNTVISLESYNVIVGPNNSGKTNLVRILKFLKTPSEGLTLHGINQKKILQKMKLYKNRASCVRIDILLSQHEIKILLQFLLNKKIEGTIRDELRKISLVIGWENIYDDNIPPDFLLLHLANGFTIWKEDSHDVWSCIDGIPEGSEQLLVAIQDMVKIPADIEKREEYQREKNFPAIYMLSQGDFQHEFICKQSVQRFFQLGDRIITVTSDFHMAYDGTLNNEQKKLTIEVFQFLGIPTPTGSINLWLLIQGFINKMTVQSEQHPGIPDLATDLHLFKDQEDKKGKYKSICNEFSKLFPNISFDTFSSDEKEFINVEYPKYVIKITEESPGQESLCSFNLDDSASGYFEALYLLYEKWRYEDHILILDEPAVRIHPNVIRHLGRILSTSNRQIILVTHSPYFVDVSMIGGSKRLIYFKRENRTTEVLGTSKIQIKSYIFDPNIFFSRCIIVLEGAGDVACFYAMSDALDSVFERYNIDVVDSGGYGYIDPYIELASVYKIPYVGMVDKEYHGKINPSLDFYKLRQKLEHELVSVGLKVQTAGSIDPERAYKLIFRAMQNKNSREKIRNSVIGKVFNRALEKIHEEPMEIWDQKV